MVDPAELDILVVEDSESDTHLVIRELGRCGFSPSWLRVDSVSSLRAALRRRSWQLVISDSSVPRIGALDALAIVREVLPAVPFILVSGTLREETAVAAIRAGAAAFVSKNDLRALGPVVARELERARRPQAHEVARRLLAAQENERRRTADQLHDQLHEVLTALRLDLEAAHHRAGGAGEQKLVEALQLVDQAFQRARDFPG